MAAASDAPATRAEPGAKPEPESSATPKPAPAAVSLSVTLTSVPRAIQRVAAEPRVPAHSTGTVEPGKPRVKEVGFVTPMPPLAPQNPIETMNVEAALEPPRGDISHAQDIQVSATSRQKSKVDETEVRRTVRVLQEQPHGQEVTLAIEPPDKLEGIFNNTARRQPLDDNAVPSATPAIRPRITETRIQLPVVKPATTLSAPPHVSPLPIHVRIGRVEVREAPAPGGTAPAPPPTGTGR